jgi:hypothetical protein
LQPESAGRSWGLWTKQQPLVGVFKQPKPAAHDDPTRFKRTVRSLLFASDGGRKPVAAVADLYTPEALVLAVELARQAGIPTWESMASSVRARYHALGRWLDDLAKRRSPVIFYRSGR